MSGGRPAAGLSRGGKLRFVFEGRTISAHEGETIGAALWANGETHLRDGVRDGSPRGMFCGMGICFECLVLVDGREVRACTTPARPGQVVRRRDRSHRALEADEEGATP